MKKNKEKILATKIIDLGLGVTAKYVFGDSLITVKEYIDLNPGIFTNKMPFNNGKKLNSDASKKFVFWKKLSTFLLANGFDYHDWLALLPNNNISLLKPGKILDLPFYFVTGMKYSCEPMIFIARYFLWEEKDEDVFSDEEERARAKTIKILEVIKLTPRAIKTMIARGNYRGEPVEIGKREMFRIALGKAQEKLKKLGFTKKLGSFMDIVFYPSNDKQLVKYISQNKDITKTDSGIFLSLAKKIGLKINPQLLEE